MVGVSRRAGGVINGEGACRAELAQVAQAEPEARVEGGGGRAECRENTRGMRAAQGHGVPHDAGRNRRRAP